MCGGGRVAEGRAFFRGWGVWWEQRVGDLVVTAALESGWAADRHEQIGDVLAWCAGWLGAGVGGE